MLTRLFSNSCDEYLYMKYSDGLVLDLEVYTNVATLNIINTTTSYAHICMYSCPSITIFGHLMSFLELFERFKAFHIPEQSLPSPVKPAIHLQLYEPTVFVQLAFK